MSYFEGQTPAWATQHGRQQSWDQSQNSAHSSSVSTPQREEFSAFNAQFEEIDRASDNLMRTGKTFGGGAGRRELPPSRYARGYPDFDRMPNPQRHNPAADYDGMRSHSAHSSTSLQGYYAAQRFGPRPSEAEQMMQAKRRAAAQRERDLRNYHQEQQYNRNLSAAKSDRSMSPSAMSEEDRRELIARQHRALYGDGAALYGQDGMPSRPLSQDARVNAGTPSGHGSTPLAFDAFSPPASSASDGIAQASPAIGTQQQRSPTNSTTSKSPNPNAFTMFDNQQQNTSPSASSPGGSPPRQSAAVPGTSSVAPIGTRPAQVANQPKRATPPTSAPLNFGFANEKTTNNAAERSASAASNPTSGGAEKPVGLGWGSTTGPWSSNKHTLGVQASVWG